MVGRYNLDWVSTSGLTWSLAPPCQESAQPEDDRPLILLHNLETHTEGEGEGEDDQEEGDDGEDQATQADPCLLFITSNNILR